MDEVMDGMISGCLSMSSDVSRYAGFSRSIETTDSFPFTSNVKCLSLRLITLKGCYNGAFTASCRTNTCVHELRSLLT